MQAHTSSNGLLRHHISSLKNILFNGDDLFTAILGPKFLNGCVSEFYPTTRKRIFCPLVTVKLFLYQVLSQDHSCRNALANFIAKHINDNNKNCSYLTGGYCQARIKIPLNFLKKIAKTIAEKNELMIDQQWLWRGKNIFLVDGTTIAAPDTPENQSEYPQNIRQKAGLGFPIMRIVGVFSLATGSLIDLAFGAYSGKGNGETTIFKSLLHLFKEGDVIVFDRYYTGASTLVALQKSGIDFVGRSFGAKKIDFRKGIKIGARDHIVDFKHDQNVIEVREVEIEIKQTGFRAKKIVLVTSFIDAKEYPKEELAKLYMKRWHVEIDIGALKTTMGMNELRCKTPEMLRKEVYMHMIGYNLIRSIMCISSRLYGFMPRQISFKSTLQLMTVATSFFSKRKFIKQLIKLLEAIAQPVVGNRSGRYEPRAIKHRRKADRFLTVPRQQARSLHWHHNRAKHRSTNTKCVN